MKKLQIILFFNLMLNITLYSQSVVYNNKLEWVLGDVKQGFIHNTIKTQQHVDNILKGFKEMKLNGIRVPIFAKDSIPNPSIYNYLITRAREEGFRIFANPALTSGGARIACGVLFSEPKAVLNNTKATQQLIDQIRDFAQNYPCRWICPFNEDGRPGKTWSKAQMNTIFSSLHGTLNGAELIGACNWGIEAAIEVIQQTNIHSYITVSTTHNLGFEHSLWPSFISHSGNLPVWDSETNYNDKYGTGTRIEIAIQNGVNGIVLYDSFKTINMNNGSLKSTALELMSLYLDSELSINGQAKDLHKININNNVLYISDNESKIDLYTTQGIQIPIHKIDSYHYTTDIQEGIYLVHVKSTAKSNLQKIYLR